jgi:hypothetical protein
MPTLSDLRARARQSFGCCAAATLSPNGSGIVGTLTVNVIC